jgi:plasmid stabilization system protein ParE
MAEVRWSLTAAEDLRDVAETVARDSPVYAVRLTDRLVEAVERLEPFPLSGLGHSRCPWYQAGMKREQIVTEDPGILAALRSSPALAFRPTPWALI